MDGPGRDDLLTVQRFDETGSRSLCGSGSIGENQQSNPSSPEEEIAIGSSSVGRIITSSSSSGRFLTTFESNETALSRPVIAFAIFADDLLSLMHFVFFTGTLLMRHGVLICRGKVFDREQYDLLRRAHREALPESLPLIDRCLRKLTS